MIKKSLLNNGIRVVTEEMPYVNSVAIGFWIKVGSRHEEDSYQGITHFIEHLLFKGTTSRNAKQIAEELENIGGSLNAFTSREYTCLYARVLKENVDIAINLLSDMILNSLFDVNEIEKEKNVISEEIMMYEDTPDELIHDLFTQKVWYGHALARAILGTKDSIMSFSREDIIDYYQKHFTKENIIVTAAGNLNHDIFLEKIQAKLGLLNSSANNNIVTNPVFKPIKYARIKQTEQTHLCIGTKGVSQHSKKLYALMVFNNLFGGGISSRLFQSIREDLGLAYSIYSYISVYSDEGLFVIYAGTSPKNSEKVLGEISKQIHNIFHNGISQEELERTKNQLKGNILLSMENVSHRMSRLGRTMVSYDDVVTANEVINKIMDVTQDDLYDLGNLLGDFNNYSLISIGPYELF